MLLEGSLHGWDWWLVRLHLSDAEAANFCCSIELISLACLEDWWSRIRLQNLSELRLLNYSLAHDPVALDICVGSSAICWLGRATDGGHSCRLGRWFCYRLAVCLLKQEFAWLVRLLCLSLWLLFYFEKSNPSINHLAVYSFSSFNHYTYIQIRVCGGRPTSRCRHASRSHQPCLLSPLHCWSQVVVELLIHPYF